MADPLRQMKISQGGNRAVAGSEEAAVNNVPWKKRKASGSQGKDLYSASLPSQRSFQNALSL